MPAEGEGRPLARTTFLAFRHASVAPAGKRCNGCAGPVLRSLNKLLPLTLTLSPEVAGERERMRHQMRLPWPPRGGEANGWFRSESIVIAIDGPSDSEFGEQAGQFGIAAGWRLPLDLGYECTSLGKVRCEAF